jgi:hypothetical protein
MHVTLHCNSHASAHSALSRVRTASSLLTLQSAVNALLQC